MAMLDWSFNPFTLRNGNDETHFSFDARVERPLDWIGWLWRQDEDREKVVGIDAHRLAVDHDDDRNEEDGRREVNLAFSLWRQPGIGPAPPKDFNRFDRRA